MLTQRRKGAEIMHRLSRLLLSRLPSAFALLRKTYVTGCCALIWCLLSPHWLCAQSGLLPLDGREGRNLLLENFRPKPMLKVTEHEIPRAKFPVVDVHTHFRHK